MSTYTHNKIPNCDWFIINTSMVLSRNITPELSQMIHKNGYKYIYITLGIKYGERQKKYQQSLIEDSYKILENITFDAVVIDSLNCCHSSIKNIFPSNLYILGKRDFLSRNLHDSWTGISVNPHTNVTNIEYKIFKQLSNFPSNSYPMVNWYYQDQLNKIYNLKRILSPEDQEKQRIKKERDESKFGKIIEIFERYYRDNWLCDTTNETLDDKHFEIKYNHHAQANIKQYNIKYNFKDKTYYGGYIVKPISPIHRFEFEYFFGFASKCSDFNDKKTRYYYKTDLSISRSKYSTFRESIYDFLEKFQDCEWDKEFCKFLIWAGVNHLGLLLYNVEECCSELSEVMNLSNFTKEEIYDLCYPKPN